MIYIDIDGTLADTDGYLSEVNPNAFKDTHTLFKTFFKFYETVFKESKPLVNLDFIKDLEDFTLLTAMPNKFNIASFTDDVDTIMARMYQNKLDWVHEHIGDCKVIITDGRSDKVKYCNGPADILIDDNKDTGKKWQEAGGTYYSSVAEFLRKKDNVVTGQTMSVTQLW